MKRLHKAVIVYFIIATVAMIWPVYPYFSRIYPLVLGMPFSLFYLICVLLLSFLVLAALYFWDERRGTA